LLDNSSAIGVVSGSIGTGEWLVSENWDKSLGLGTRRNKGGEKESEEEGEEGEEGRGTGVKF